MIPLPKQSGLRPPSSGIGRSNSSIGSGLKRPDHSGLVAPRSTCPQSSATPRNSCSTLPRASSNKNDSVSSDSGSDAPSPAGIIVQPKSLLRKPKSSSPPRNDNSSTGSGESKLEQLRMTREKSADILRTPRDRSSDSLRKLSTSSLPSSRNALNLLSRESTSENLKKGSIAAAVVKSAKNVSQSTGEIYARTTPNTTGISAPRTVSGLKKPSAASGIAGPRKISAGGPPQESKLKQPNSSGDAPFPTPGFYFIHL